MRKGYTKITCADCGDEFISHTRKICVKCRKEEYKKNFGKSGLFKYNRE